MVKAEEGRVALTLLVLFILAFALFAAMDWVTFHREFARYASEAEMPDRSIPLSVEPDEAIVALTGDARRIPVAIQLLRKRKSPLLIITGTGRGATLTDLINQSGAAVPDVREIWKKIILESKATSTIENAEQTAKILHEKGVHRVVLVTSDFHMPRSLAIFRKIVPDIVYIAYPVSSSDASLAAHGAAGEGQWRLVWTEFWKYFVFEHLVLGRLQPAVS